MQMSTTHRIVVMTAASMALPLMAVGDTFTWHGPDAAIGSGTFGTAGNWFDSSNARTQAIPGAEDTVKFITNGINLASMQTVTLDADRSVASLTVDGGNERATARYANATLALGGNTLTVGGQLCVKGTQGWSGRSGLLTMQGGTVNVGSVQIGPSGTWAGGSGSLYVQGAGTKLNSTGEIMMEGAFTALHVLGGAEVSGVDLTVAGNAQNKSQIGETGMVRSMLRISGDNTKVTIRGFALHHDIDAMISDGAVVKSTSWGYYRHGTGGFKVASLNRDYYGNCVGGAWGTYGTWCGNSGTLIVDNATFTSDPAQHFAVGCSRAATGGTGATLTLRNNAKFKSAEFFIGVSIESTSYDSTNNVLNVLSGSELEASIVRVSQCGNTSFGKVNVSNATIKCQQLLMGNYINASIINSNACLTVSGEAPSITLSSTAADAFKARMGTQLRFVLPEDGFASAPISVKGGVSIVADENSYAVDPVRLIIDADAFGRKHGGASQTLIECVTASSASLQRLADNLVFVNTREYRQGTVSVVGGTKLVYTAPPPLGMMLIVL